MTELELQQLVVQITEARAAYHQLVTGNKPRVFVDQNGERVEFMAANRSSLYQYIQSLEAKLAAATATPAHNPIGPAGFFF